MWIDVADHRRHLARFLAALGCAVGGCQHNRANQYSYAPPLAAPVYPQPQQAGGPVVFGPPPAAPPQAALPVAGPVPVAGPTVSPVFSSGPVVPQALMIPTGDPCDPCHEGVVTAGSVYVDGGQTPPCPPGP